jgi:lipopolysaccharide transport system permease protein
MPLSQYFRLVDIQARMALKADASKFFLGYIWWLLEPMLYVGVFYVVFDIILDSGRADFLPFLLCGKWPFVWFSKTVNQAANSIIAGSGLIGRIDVPKSIFPMAVVQESVYKQSTVFLLLFIALYVMGYTPDLGWLWIIPVILVQLVMIIACSLIGAVLVCFVRDFSMFISLGMIFLMFTSGIFWDARSLDPEMGQRVLNVNPLAFILDAYRQVLMYDTPPEMGHLLLIGVGFGALAVLVLAYMRSASKYLALRALTA